VTLGYFPQIGWISLVVNEHKIGNQIANLWCIGVKSGIGRRPPLGHNQAGMKNSSTGH
jgi:hypothetical protein